MGFAQRPLSQDVAAVGPAVEHIAQADGGVGGAGELCPCVKEP